MNIEEIRNDEMSHQGWYLLVMDFAQGSVQNVIGPAGGGCIPAGGNGTEVEMNNSFNV